MCLEKRKRKRNHETKEGDRERERERKTLPCVGEERRPKKEATQRKHHLRARKEQKPANPNFQPLFVL
jgi:hypothetical protein